MNSEESQAGSSLTPGQHSQHGCGKILIGENMRDPSGFLKAATESTQCRPRIPVSRRRVKAEELGRGLDTPFLGTSVVPVNSSCPQAPWGLLMPCHVPVTSSSSKRVFPSVSLNFPVPRCKGDKMQVKQRRSVSLTAMVREGMGERSEYVSPSIVPERNKDRSCGGRGLHCTCALAAASQKASSPQPETSCPTCASACRLSWLKSGPSCDSPHKKHPLQIYVSRTHTPSPQLSLLSPPHSPLLFTNLVIRE